jgi:hypothetical protein
VGWGSCTTCAGGENESKTVISTEDGVTTMPTPPSASTDPASRVFNINGPSYANGLWWYKVGANNTVTNFSFNYFLQVNSGSSNAQALEFDVFQFVSPYEYMFGTQCNYAYGYWQVWNGKAGAWEKTRIPCQKFQPGVWYQITETFNRTSTVEYYDSLTIVKYPAEGKPVTTTYNFNANYPAGPLPSDWTADMGVQFQVDFDSKGGTISEWVNGVTLSVH